MTMNLDSLQHELFHLIQGDSPRSPETHSYILEVAVSPQLQLVRSIALWWRVFGIERFCPLTSALLRRDGTLEDLVQTFLRQTDVSPYIEQLGLAFVTEMTGHNNRLVACVAEFERALIRVKQGDANTYRIEWAHEPYAILDRLLRNLPLLESELEGRFHTIVSSHLPRLFEVVEEHDALLATDTCFSVPE